MPTLVIASPQPSLQTPRSLSSSVLAGQGQISFSHPIKYLSSIYYMQDTVLDVVLSYEKKSEDPAQRKITEQ